MIEKDPFEILGLPYGSKDSVVKSRYKDLAKYYHPDLAEGNAEKMKAINEAYEAIKRGDYHSEEYYHPHINSRIQQQEENAAARQREAESFRQNDRGQSEKKSSGNPQYIPVWYWHGIPLSKKQYILLLVWKRFFAPLLLIAVGFLLLNFIWGQLFNNTLLEEIKSSFEQTGDFFQKASENSLIFSNSYLLKIDL